MLCQKCHKNLASIRYAEVVDGLVKNLHLCQECIAKREDNSESGFELSEPAQFSHPKKPSRSMGRAAMSSETCKACETELRMIVASENVGCVQCYETFPAELEAVLEGIHHALIHRGKSSQANDEQSQRQQTLQGKRALLKTALAMEDYEGAAVLRDAIQQLEKDLDESRIGAAN